MTTSPDVDVRPSEDVSRHAQTSMFSRLPKRRTVTIVLLGVVLLFLLYPVIMALLGSVFSGVPGQSTGSLTFSGWSQAYQDSQTYRTWRDSAEMMVYTAVVSGVLGTTLAWLVSRTDTIGVRFLRSALLLPLFMPSILIGMAWTIVGDRIARVTSHIPVLSTLLPSGYSMTGLVLSLSVVATPFVYVLLLPSFDSMNISLEQAAATSGASTFKTLTHVSLPLLAPALFAAAILTGVRTLDTLDVPMLVGRPAHIKVFASQIYLSIYGTPFPTYSKASALGASLTGACFILVGWSLVYTRRRSFFTVAGRSSQASTVHLGRRRYLAGAFAWGYLFVGVVCPIAIVLVASFERSAGLWDGDFTLANWSAILNGGEFRSALENTVIIGVLGSIAMAVIGCFTAYCIVRSRGRGKIILELGTWMPWATPGVLLAIGILWAYGDVSGLYGSKWILLVADVSVYTPLTVRQYTAAMHQISPVLEHAGWMNAAGKFTTFRLLVLPLLRQTTLASMLLGFVFIVREISMSAFLVTPSSEVLGVLTLQSWTQGATGQAAACGVCMVLLSGIALVLYGVLSRVSPRSGRVDLDAEITNELTTGMSIPDEEAAHVPA